MLAFPRHADARSLADARRDADVNRPRMTVVLQREAPRRAVIRILEPQLQFVFDVAAHSRRPSARAARAPSRIGAAAAEERLKEVGERVLVAEHLPHFVFGHRAESTLTAGAAPEIHIPAAELTRIESGRSAGAALARLLVHPPVRAELVVLLALGRIAEHLVRLVNFLELRFRRLV